jgi:hypothetical protein
VQPHWRCSDLLACFSERSCDRVRVVGPLCRRIRREDIGGGFDRCPRFFALASACSSAPSRASACSILLRFVGYHPSWFPSRVHRDAATDRRMRRLPFVRSTSLHWSPATSPRRQTVQAITATRFPRLRVIRHQVIDHRTNVGGGWWVHLPGAEGRSFNPVSRDDRAIAAPVHAGDHFSSVCVTVIGSAADDVLLSLATSVTKAVRAMPNSSSSHGTSWMRIAWVRCCPARRMHEVAKTSSLPSACVRAWPLLDARKVQRVRVIATVDCQTKFWPTQVIRHSR